MEHPRHPFSSRYELVSPVREGLAPAFRLRDTLRDHDVYWRALAPGATDLTRLVLAHAIWSELAHPAAASPGEWGETAEGGLYVTTAWVEGMSATTASRLTPAHVREILVSLATLLDRLHALGWLHGDLVPAALIIRPDGQPVLTSWRRLHPEGSPMRGLEGPNLPYSPPECLRGGRADRRSEVYALGALAHTLLTGAPPHAAATPTALREVILTQPVRRPSGLLVGIPSNLDALLAAMLAKDPAERPASMAAVLEALGQPVAAPASRVFQQSPLRGHQAALERFDAQVKALGQGHSDALWLRGEPGVGKSLLAETLVARARNAGVPVVSAQGHTRAAPWTTWRHLLEGVLPLARMRAGASRAESINSVLQMLDELSLRPPSGGPQQALLRSRVYDASLDALTCAAADRGLVVVLDDGDLLDSPSSAALAHVQRALRAGGTAPVLLVVVGTDGPRVAGWDEVALSPLDEADLTAWLKAVVGAEAVPRRFVLALSAHSGGRPAIARLALGHLLATGIVAARPTGFRLPETLWSGAVPAWGGALEERLVGQLGEGARALGALVTLWPGLGLSLPEAAAALGATLPHLERAARELLAAGLASLGEEGLRVHGETIGAALAAAVAPELPAAWLAALREGGSVLDSAEGLPFQALLDQARLLLAQPAAPGAIEVGLAAARRCVAAGARGEATALFEAVRELVAAGNQPPQRQQLEVGLGLVASQAAGAPQPSELLVLARRCVAQEPDEEVGEHLLLAALWHASAALAHEREAEPLLQEALELAERLGDEEAREDITLRLARGLLLRGRGPEAIDRVADIVGSASKRGSLAWSRALAVRGQADLDGDVAHQAAGLGDLQGAAAAQETIGDREGLLETLAGLVRGALQLCRFGEAVTHGERLLALPSSHDRAALRQGAAAAMAVALAELGQLNGVLELVARVNASTLPPLEPSWQATSAALGFWVRVQLGRLAAAEADLEPALQALGMAPPSLLGRLSLACVRGLLALGRLDQAARVAQELQLASRATDLPEVQLAWCLAMAEVNARRGEPLAAHSFAEQGFEAATALGLDHWLGQAHLQRALAAQEAEAFAVAVRHALEAERLALAGKERLAVATARLLAGEAALKTGDPEAVGHFQVARMIADDLGALLMRACALDGLGRCSPLAPEAVPFLGDAQRLLRQASQGLGEASSALFGDSALVRHIIERRAVGDGGLSMTAQSHQTMLDRLGRLSAELTGVTSHYGLMIDAWVAKREQLKKLNELARTINGSLELDDVAQAVLQVALELTGAERAYFLLKSQGRYEDLIVRAGLDRQGRDVLGQRFSMSICLRVAATGEAAALMDGAGVEGLEPGKSVAALNLKTLMCAPLMVKGRCIGVLYVDSQAALRMYTLQDLDQLSAIAAHASIAFDNAMLYDSLTRHTAELEKTLAEVRKAEAAAGHDALTGLRNRRAFMATADRELALAKRQGRSLAVLLLDVDHFKRFNDDFGHHVGDEVLRLVGRCLLEAARDTDMPARLGGEEFVVLCPETEPEAAMRLAERVRAQIESLTPSDPTGRPLRSVTASIGVAGWTPEDATIDVVLARADRALYAAKEAGRNQCRLGGEAGVGKA